MAQATSEEYERILAAQQGKTQAFAQIVVSYERSIFNYILRLVNRREDAEDLTQETFLRLYTHIKEIIPEKGPKSWLYTTATHLVYDWLRFKRRRPEDLIIDTDNETIRLEPTYTTIEADITSLDLDQALGQMKPVYASLLLLYYKEGLQYEEIAQALAIPLGTVKTQLHRAKAELEKHWTHKMHSVHGT